MKCELPVFSSACSVASFHSLKLSLVGLSISICMLPAMSALAFATDSMARPRRTRSLPNRVASSKAAFGPVPAAQAAVAEAVAGSDANGSDCPGRQFERVGRTRPSKRPWLDLTEEQAHMLWAKNSRRNGVEWMTPEREIPLALRARLRLF
jgi:hypothetical protein